MALPDWYDNRRENNRRSREQERTRARQTGGRTRSGSGSSWRAPQDVRSPERLEQLKFTTSKSFALKGPEMCEVLADALRDGREPGMVIDFTRYGVRAVVTIEAL